LADLAIDPALPDSRCRPFSGNNGTARRFLSGRARATRCSGILYYCAAERCREARAMVIRGDTAQKIESGTTPRVPDGAELVEEPS
jgi:hypothetical protein